MQCGVPPAPSSRGSGRGSNGIYVLFPRLKGFYFSIMHIEDRNAPSLF